MLLMCKALNRINKECFFRRKGNQYQGFSVISVTSKQPLLTFLLVQTINLHDVMLSSGEAYEISSTEKRLQRQAECQIQLLVSWKQRGVWQQLSLSAEGENCSLEFEELHWQIMLLEIKPTRHGQNLAEKKSPCEVSASMSAGRNEFVQ